MSLYKLTSDPLSLYSNFAGRNAFFVVFRRSSRKFIQKFAKRNNFRKEFRVFAVFFFCRQIITFIITVFGFSSRYVYVFFRYLCTHPWDTESNITISTLYFEPWASYFSKGGSPWSVEGGLLSGYMWYSAVGSSLSSSNISTLMKSSSMGIDSVFFSGGGKIIRSRRQ